MRIAFYNRPDNNVVFGGDVVQMHKTGVALDNLYGNNVIIEGFSSRTPKELMAWKPDIIHVFGIYGTTYNFLKEIKSYKDHPPIVLSTIYLSLSQLYWAQNLIYRSFLNKEYNLLHSLKRREGFARIPIIDSHYESVFNMVDGWLPNGVGELYDIRNDFNVTAKPFKIVPNSISEDFFEESSVDVSSLFRDIAKPFVVVVGRIEPRKNQAMLLHALKDTDIPVVFIGQKSDEGYWNICTRIRTFYHYEHMSHSQLRGTYNEDCIYVLPSWLESPSLASMEALASGCPIVIGNQGTEYEYFGDYATYCDPASAEDIRDKVLCAINNREQLKNRAKEFATIAKERYTWEKTAEETYNFYLKFIP